MREVMRSMASFLRWQLAPVRYAGRLRFLRLHHLTPASPPNLPLTKQIERDGYAPGPKVDSSLLAEIQAMYLARSSDHPPEGLKVPFINLVEDDDFNAANPLMKFAFSKEVLDLALDYFGGRARCDSIQVLNSFPSSGPLKESQKWHLDYGDSRSFHCVTYVNDVLSDDQGPFVFANKIDSKRVGRGLIVRRIDDNQMLSELGPGQVIKVYGKAGSSILIDPAVCYHYGSRCKTRRVAIFVTFNSDKPFVHATSLARKNAEKLRDVGRQLRPDLPPDVLDRLFNI